MLSRIIQFVFSISVICFTAAAQKNTPSLSPEIGLLYFQGGFHCFLDKEPCADTDNVEFSLFESADAESPSTSKLSRKNFTEFERVHDMDGEALLVFNKTADRMQIQDRTGKRLWLSLDDIRKQNLKKYAGVDVFKFVTIEDLFKEYSIPTVAPEFEKYLKSSDLKTNLKLPYRPDPNEREFPSGYIQISKPCVYETNAETAPFICKGAGHIDWYAEASKKSSQLFSAEISPAHMNGHMVIAGTEASGSVRPQFITEYVFVYDEKNGFLMVRPMVEQVDPVWIRLSDVKKNPKLKYVKFNLREERKNFWYKLNPKYKFSESDYRILNFVRITWTGKLKKDTQGLLWLEVDVNHLPDPKKNNSTKQIIKGWLPYKLEFKNPRIVNWLIEGD